MRQTRRVVVQVCNTCVIVPDDSGSRWQARCQGCGWSSPWWPSHVTTGWVDVTRARDARARAVDAAGAHMRQQCRRRPAA